MGKEPWTQTEGRCKLATLLALETARKLPRRPPEVDLEIRSAAEAVWLRTVANAEGGWCQTELQGLKGQSATNSLKSMAIGRRGLTQAELAGRGSVGTSRA